MSFVTYQADGAIGTILLNRPEALNALNSKVLDELNAVLDQVDQNVIRCLIISGSGAGLSACQNEARPSRKPVLVCERSSLRLPAHALR